MGAQLQRNAQAYFQLLFGREREGGASLREAASLAIPLQMVLLPHVHGGFVSRRELAQLQRRSPHLAWGRNSEGTHKLIPSYSSGGSAREGLLLEKPPPSQYPFKWHFAACSRRLCQPPWTRATATEVSPPRMGAQLRRNTQAYSQLLFGRKREGGASLREAASLAT